MPKTTNAAAIGGSVLSALCSLALCFHVAGFDHVNGAAAFCQTFFCLSLVRVRRLTAENLSPSEKSITEWARCPPLPCCPFPALYPSDRLVTSEHGDIIDVGDRHTDTPDRKQVVNVHCLRKRVYNFAFVVLYRISAPVCAL